MNDCKASKKQARLWSAERVHKVLLINPSHSWSRLPKRAFCKQENYLFDNPQVVAWPRSRDFPSHGVFDKVVNKRSIPYQISIFKRLIVSKTGVSTKSLISSGLLVNALLKQSSQHAHIMICQKSSELSEWKKQARIDRIWQGKVLCWTCSQVRSKIFQRVDFLLKKLSFYQEFMDVKGSKTLALCLIKSLSGDLLYELKGGTKEENRIPGIKREGSPEVNIRHWACLS